MPVILGRFSALVSPNVQQGFWSVVEKPAAPIWSKLLMSANPARSYTRLKPARMTVLSLSPKTFLKGPESNRGE